MLEDEGFEVRNREVELKLREIGMMLGQLMPDDYLFTLLILKKGEGGGMFYISNAQREDMISLLKEMIEKFEGLKQKEKQNAT